MRIGKKGMILVVVALLVFGMVAVAGCTSNTTPTATPTVTTPTVTTPTATPVPPVVTTPAPSSSGNTLSTSDLAVLTSYMEGQGYTMISPFVANGTSGGYPTYTGMMTKGGINFAVTLEQTDSSTHAASEANGWVVAAQSMGFSGSTQSDGSWLGTMTDPNTGNPVGAYVGTSGNTVIVLIGE